MRFSSDLTQLVNFPYLDPWLWLSQFYCFGFCLFPLTLVLVIQWLSIHWEILIVVFLSNSQWNALFYCIAYDYFCTNLDVSVIIWEMFLGRISLNSVLLLLLVGFLSVQVGSDVCMPHLKCQVKPHSSP